ncbi:MAG TPA: NAD-dependent epimerase/dehydratase family protein [Sphingomonas sp.]|nr:NAD-dependent epimerase/dehydratase family protein [Sphingomonas sp.]
MNILITGGAGFIGSRLALRLIERGHDVTVLDTLSPQIHGDDPDASPLFASIRDKVRFVRGTVTDRAAMEQVLAGQEAVVHLAAETGTGQSMYQIEHYSAVNVGGTALMLDILANAPHSVKRIVVASSRSIYGEGRYRSAELGDVYPGARDAADMSAGDFAVKYPGATTPLELVATDEDSKIHPSSVYGITKQVQEQLVMTVCPSLGIEGVAFRYQNVFGPGQSLSNPYTGILSIFSNLMMQGKPINIFEDGTESRDFVFVDDVVEATVLGVEHPAAANQIFNVGTGVPVSVMTVAQTLKRLIDADVPITVTGNFRIGDIRHNYADMTRIEALLGFRPAYDFERGIAKFVEWARATGARSSAYEASLDEMRAKGLLK